MPRTMESEREDTLAWDDVLATLGEVIEAELGVLDSEDIQGTIIINAGTRCIDPSNALELISDGVIRFAVKKEA